MTILDKIVEEKRGEVSKRKQTMPVSSLRMLKAMKRETHPFPAATALPFFIAEYKRRSPSKGKFAAADKPVLEIATAYATAGASAVSILTDAPFFGGCLEDLQQVREALPDLPVLRKDFIIDPYQLYESKAFGADIILLIASVLSPGEVRDLSGLAHELGLSVLLELHDEGETGYYQTGIDMLGINNRNLKTFDVDTERSIRMLKLLPTGVPVVAESGLHSVEKVLELYNAGFSGFLMGEHFMNSEDPGLQLAGLINRINR